MRGMILHIRNAKNLQADVDYLELKDLLNPSDFDGDDRPECLENTRKETLDSIYQWVDARGYPNVLLLIGAVGTGKSTIATTVAGEYLRRRQHVFLPREKSHKECSPNRRILSGCVQPNNSRVPYRQIEGQL